PRSKITVIELPGRRWRLCQSLSRITNLASSSSSLRWMSSKRLLPMRLCPSIKRCMSATLFLPRRASDVIMPLVGHAGRTMAKPPQNTYWIAKHLGHVAHGPDHGNPERGDEPFARCQISSYYHQPLPRSPTIGHDACHQTEPPQPATKRTQNCMEIGRPSCR